jgi:hypothetical protein
VRTRQAALSSANGRGCWLSPRAGGDTVIEGTRLERALGLAIGLNRFEGSTYHRGAELLMGAFNWLDLVPKGRNESAGPMSWVQRHDEY